MDLRRGRAGQGAGETGRAQDDQGRAAPRQPRDASPVAALGLAGARGGMGGDARAWGDYIVIALALLLAMAPAHSTAPADTPNAFLKRLYARYESGNLNPFPRQEQVYAPELVRQMRLNARL